MSTTLTDEPPISIPRQRMSGRILRMSVWLFCIERVLGGAVLLRTELNRLDRASAGSPDYLRGFVFGLERIDTLKESRKGKEAVPLGSGLSGKADLFKSLRRCVLVRADARRDSTLGHRIEPSIEIAHKGVVVIGSARSSVPSLSQRAAS